MGSVMQHPDSQIFKTLLTCLLKTISHPVNVKTNSTLSANTNACIGKPIPAAKIRTLQNGSVRVSVGNFVGMALHPHLTEQRIHQLRDSWLKANTSFQL